MENPKFKMTTKTLTLGVTYIGDYVGEPYETEEMALEDGGVTTAV